MVPWVGPWIMAMGVGACMDGLDGWMVWVGGGEWAADGIGILLSRQGRTGQDRAGDRAEGRRERPMCLPRLF